MCGQNYSSMELSVIRMQMSNTYLFDSLHLEPFGCRVNFLYQFLVCL